MLNIFLGRKPLPNYRLTQPAQMEKIIVKENVSRTKVGRQFEDIRGLSVRDRP